MGQTSVLQSRLSVVVSSGRWAPRRSDFMGSYRQGGSFDSGFGTGCGCVFGVIAALVMIPLLLIVVLFFGAAFLTTVVPSAPEIRSPTIRSEAREPHPVPSRDFV